MSRPVVDANHGTYSRYRKGCRCGECMAASRARSNGMDRATGRLLVECWCRTDEVLVAAAVVKAGRTGSCGRKRCERMREAG